MPSFTRELEQTLHRSLELGNVRQHEFSTLEHLLLALLDDVDAAKVMRACDVDLDALRSELTNYLDTELEALSLAKLKRKRKKTDEEKAKIAEFNKSGPTPTSGFQRVVQRAILHVQSTGRDEVSGANVLVALFSERETYAVGLLLQQNMSRLDAVTFISHGVGKRSSHEPETLAAPTVTIELSELDETDKITAKLKRIFRDDLRPVFDTVSLDPVLNTPRIADKIVELVLDIVEQATLSKSDQPVGRRPLLTLGIYGPWGSGKSTLLRRIARRMSEERFVTVLINTWKWEGGEDVFSFMNRELLDSLAQVKGMRLQARLIQGLLWIRQNAGRWIGWFAVAAGLLAAYFSVDWRAAITTVDVTRGSVLALATGALVAAVAKPVGTLIEKIILRGPGSIDSKQSLSTSYRYLSWIRRLPYRVHSRPVAFLFDDLDRCDDTRVVEFIKSMHSLTSDGSVCIMACDDRFAGAAIYSQFKQVADYLGEGQEFGAKFLEKIIQIPFRIPEVAPDDLIALGLRPAIEIPELSSPEVGRSDPGDATERAATEPETSVGSLEVDAVSEIRLSEICGETLALVVEPARLQIRQAKMLSNLVKLYSMVFPPADEAAARRLSAFLIVSYVDPLWIPSRYLGTPVDSRPSVLDPMEQELRSYLGDDGKALSRLYRLCGVRVPAPAHTSPS